MTRSEEIVREYYFKHRTLFDDALFREVARNKAFVEEMLRVILEDNKLQVIEAETQKEFSVLNQRGVVLDCYCKQGDGRIIDVEIEKNDRYDKCDHQKRVRYYGSMINIKNLKHGQEYSELPEVYVIYITKKDIFKLGKTIYHIDRVLRESNNVADNGYHEIYVNAEVDDKTDIAELMKTMSTKDYFSDKFRVISEVKEEKSMPVEVEKAFEDLKVQYSAEGKIEGKAEGMTQAFISMYKQNLISEEVVLTNLHITKEELENIMKEYA